MNEAVSKKRISASTLCFLSTFAFALFTMLEVPVILVLVEEEVFQGYAQDKEK